MATAAPAGPAAPPARAEQNRTVDSLRGLAALAVVWFHFTNGDPSFLPEGWLKSSGRYGWLGVEIFFVISGFIVPWSLWRSQYRFADYPRFLLKRLLRLHPPYLVAVAISVADRALATHLYGTPFEVDPLGLVLHLAYLNGFFGLPWLNPLFWTLAIWAQFYVVVGLFGVALTSQRHAVRRTALALFAALALLPTPGTFVFRYALFFVLGISAFHHRARLVGAAEHLLVLALAGTGIALTHPPEMLVAALGSALLISFASVGHRALLFLGEISYSLYLVHGPFGGHMMRWADAMALGFRGRALLLVVTTLVTIGVAWVFYKLVELPAVRWSNAIRYRRTPAPAPTVG
jgi:peptidoglycan/LPS O-acetylase OafA/YrhL